MFSESSTGKNTDSWSHCAEDQQESRCESHLAFIKQTKMLREKTDAAEHVTVNFSKKGCYLLSREQATHHLIGFWVANITAQWTAKKIALFFSPLG